MRSRSLYLKVFARTASTCRRYFFFSSRRRHTRLVSDWSSDVCSSDLFGEAVGFVNKKDAVQRRVDHGVCARGGLADILRDESGAVALDQMPLFENSKRFVNPAH